MGSKRQKVAFVLMLAPVADELFYGLLSTWWF